MVPNLIKRFEDKLGIGCLVRASHRNGGPLSRRSQDTRSSTPFQEVQFILYYRLLPVDGKAYFLPD